MLVVESERYLWFFVPFSGSHFCFNSSRFCTTISLLFDSFYTASLQELDTVLAAIAQVPEQLADDRTLNRAFRQSLGVQGLGGLSDVIAVHV